MADSVDSDGLSADSALSFEDEPSNFDPAENGGSYNDELAVVWGLSDQLLEILRTRQDPNDQQRSLLKASLIRQLPTLFVYGKMDDFLIARRKDSTLPKTISLYVLLFPGEARDNTGIKDLNDKVIGQSWNQQYLQKRYDAIQAIFNQDDFLVAGGNYKTSFIVTFKKTRDDFKAKLAQLDEQLRQALLVILDQAEPNVTEEQKAEIRKLRKKLKKGYRFDIFFGLRKLGPQGRSSLANTYLLVTEALKGAALARFVAKAATLTTQAAKTVAAGPGVGPDPKKLDPRGKEYEWNAYIRVSDLAEKIKKTMLSGQIGGSNQELNYVYIDTVWTTTFIQYKNLYWGNPEMIRDVRKKKLERPKLPNITYSFYLVKDLLELWLVILNMLDFVKQFKSEEFDDKLKSYHDKALWAYAELESSGGSINWDNLTTVLTQDVQQSGPISVLGTASEFRFYASVADYQQRIFFSLDIRDLGVELMLDYEHSNREVGYNKYSDFDLMNETFRSSDPIDARRRFTYLSVVALFRQYYEVLSGSWVFPEALRAFGTGVDRKLGSFEESVQVMLGGDEVYVATHPLFACFVPNIAEDLAHDPVPGTPYVGMRMSVAFSSAGKIDPAHRRVTTQKSHQEAMTLAELAPGTLKMLERTHRRIERLIDMVAANDKKKARAPEYRQELESLGLRKLFARVKFGWPQQLPAQDFAKLYAVLAAGDVSAACHDPRFKLVDFTGRVIDCDKLQKDAAALESKVRQDVGADNVRVQPPPVYPISKGLQTIFDCFIEPKECKLFPKDLSPDWGQIV